MLKTIVLGVLLGVEMSLIGSFLISIMPFFPFSLIFKLSIVPSIIVFVITVWTKPNETTPFKAWFRGFITLFIVSLLTFFNFNRFEGAFHFHNHSHSTLNWDAIILYNILYSLGIALVMSPIGYVVIKKLFTLKRHQKK